MNQATSEKNAWHQPPIFLSLAVLSAYSRRSYVSGRGFSERAHEASQEAGH